MGKKLKRSQLAIEEMGEVATSQAERSDTKQEEIQNKIEGISHSEKVEAEQPTVNDIVPSRGNSEVGEEAKLRKDNKEARSLRAQHYDFKP